MRAMGVPRILEKMLEHSEMYDAQQVFTPNFDPTIYFWVKTGFGN